MKKMSTIVSLVTLLICQGFAQDKDKGEFVPSTNKFYKEIKQGIVDFEREKSQPRLSFKMDYLEKDIPRSTDEFTTVWCNNPVAQGNTGTCWCFATTSYYESEIFRITKKKIKLSELYIVYWEYVEKAREYIRTRGKSAFGEGSETNAVARMMKKYGVVPLEAYSGMKPLQKFHSHSGMFKEMKQYLKSIKRDNAWHEKEALSTIKSIMNHYIGKPPKEVTVKGKKMTPKQYLDNVTKLVPDEYVHFMSLKEKPYYEKAEYKVPDNWWRSEDYDNVPLDDFMAAIKSAVKNGYSIAIGGDVSESGYSAQNDAAMIPTYDIPSDYIDDNARQFRFSNRSTTDDHAIHLVGYKEHNGSIWFLIKDSGSGARNGNNSGWYFYHEDYVKLKIMTFTVHEDAVKDILKKMKM